MHVFRWSRQQPTVEKIRNNIFSVVARPVHLSESFALRFWLWNSVWESVASSISRKEERERDIPSGTRDRDGASDLSGKREVKKYKSRVGMRAQILKMQLPRAALKTQTFRINVPPAAFILLPRNGKDCSIKKVDPAIDRFFDPRDRLRNRLDSISSRTRLHGKQSRLASEYLSTYSPLFGWCRTTCMIRPGGYRGRCNVNAILESLGTTVCERARSLSLWYSLMHPPASKFAAEVGVEPQPQHITEHAIVFHCNECRDWYPGLSSAPALHFLAHSRNLRSHSCLEILIADHTPLILSGSTV